MVEPPSAVLCGRKYYFVATLARAMEAMSRGVNVVNPPPAEPLLENVRFWIGCAAAYACVMDVDGNLQPAGISEARMADLVEIANYPSLRTAVREATEQCNAVTHAAETARQNSVESTPVTTVQ